MKTGYRIWEKPGRRSTYRQGSIHDTLDAAKAATGMPADTTWGTNSEGNHWPENDYRGVLFVGEEEVPESLEDRVQLATDLILENAQTDGAHHKTWVLDQVLRVLTGDRYQQVIDAYCDGDDGEMAYDWDEGVAP
jgi:hypothetical protein